MCEHPPKEKGARAVCGSGPFAAEQRLPDSGKQPAVGSLPGTLLPHGINHGLEQRQLLPGGTGQAADGVQYEIGVDFGCPPGQFLSACRGLGKDYFYRGGAAFSDAAYASHLMD